MGPDLFDLVVDDIVDAALGLELCHGRVGGGQVEPLRAGLQVGLGADWIGGLITAATYRWQVGNKCRKQEGRSEMWHLDENVLHHLAAVIVHADVTGEGLAQENVSVSHTHKHTAVGIFNSMWPTN